MFQHDPLAERLITWAAPIVTVKLSKPKLVAGRSLSFLILSPYLLPSSYPFHPHPAVPSLDPSPFRSPSSALEVVSGCYLRDNFWNSTSL